MFTIMIIIGLIIGLGSLLASIVLIDNDKGWAFASIFGILVGIMLIVYGASNWFDRGDKIRAELLADPNIFVLDSKDHSFSADAYRILPKLKKRVWVIDDGQDIHYYEIIK